MKAWVRRIDLDTFASTVFELNVAAGVVTRSNVEDTSEAAWNDVIAANLTGSFLVPGLFFPA